MFWKVLLGILIVAAIALVVLYFLGRRMQKRQAAAQEQMEAMKQVVSMLIIDKKIMRLKDSGLPQAAIDQTPKYMRRSKMPIVKAKVGPRIMTLCAERDVWDVLPVKSEVKVELSGIYITAIKSVRGGTIQKPEKKKGIWARVKAKVSGKE
ncbi:MAG: hypothetical protein LUC27_07320 [Lachnospiraceae bacterium]|nr:hypothetical protein [Lachnospiraceae bacterium]MCD8330472.1 hypothetical protein [Lachnospiraceae bacterium]